MIGLLGGTFDPIHLGHIQFAIQSIEALQLSKVVLVPAAQNPLKNSGPVASGPHRLEMLARALAEQTDPRLVISPFEVRRPGPSFTVDTLEGIQQSEPGEWVLLMGNEVFERLPSWKDPVRLCSMARIAVVTRPGEREKDFSGILKLIPGLVPIRLFLDLPPYSATRIRAQLANLSRRLAQQENSPVPGLQRSVWQFIKENHLYTDP